MFCMNDLNVASWVAVHSPNDRPKSVHNRCVIEVFGGVLCCHFPLSIFCWYRGFLSLDPFSCFFFSFFYIAINRALFAD